MEKLADISFFESLSDGIGVCSDLSAFNPDNATSVFNTTNQLISCFVENSLFLPDRMYRSGKDYKSNLRRLLYDTRIEEAAGRILDCVIPDPNNPGEAMWKHEEGSGYGVRAKSMFLSNQLINALVDNGWGLLFRWEDEQNKQGLIGELVAPDGSQESTLAKEMLEAWFSSTMAKVSDTFWRKPTGESDRDRLYDGKTQNILRVMKQYQESGGTWGFDLKEGQYNAKGEPEFPVIRFDLGGNDQLSLHYDPRVSALSLFADPEESMRIIREEDGAVPGKYGVFMTGTGAQNMMDSGVMYEKLKLTVEGLGGVDSLGTKLGDAWNNSGVGAKVQELLSGSDIVENITPENIKEVTAQVFATAMKDWERREPDKYTEYKDAENSAAEKRQKNIITFMLTQAVGTKGLADKLSQLEQNNELYERLHTGMHSGGERKVLPKQEFLYGREYKNGKVSIPADGGYKPTKDVHIKLLDRLGLKELPDTPFVLNPKTGMGDVDQKCLYDSSREGGVDAWNYAKYNPYRWRRNN